MILGPSFFARPATSLAQALLGKVIRHKVEGYWRSARIIETEAYETTERASHSSPGITCARRAMCMPPGTIYMYYARGSDSLNFSGLGEGDAVLIKSGIALLDNKEALQEMLRANPVGDRQRAIHKLCSGQTLLCKSLGLKVEDWNAEQLNPAQLRVEHDGYRPSSVLKCRRLGIPAGRDDHLLYRFIDENYANSSTKNPLKQKSKKLDEDFYRISPPI